MNTQKLHKLISIGFELLLAAAIFLHHRFQRSTPAAIAETFNHLWQRLSSR